MGNVSMTIHAVGSHHNHDNPHDLNKMFARFVDELKAKGHSITHAHFHHGAAEDMLSEASPTRAGAYGALALAATLPLALAGALVLASMGMGYAANLPAKRVVRADPAPAPAAFTWTGLYAGAFAGGSISTDRYDFAGLANSGTFFGNGALLGGYAGVNYQTGNLVYGVEGDGAFANLKGGNACFPASGFVCQVESGGLFGFRGRVGYTVGGLPQPISLKGWVPSDNRWNDILLYATAGGAVRTIHANIPSIGESDTTKLGWSVGGGIEVPVSNSIIARAQYLYNDFPDFNCSPGCTGGAPIDTTVRMREHVGTVGLAYKLPPL